MTNQAGIIDDSWTQWLTFLKFFFAGDDRASKAPPDFAPLIAALRDATQALREAPSNGGAPLLAANESEKEI